MNENIAYFIGVLHTDGCIYSFENVKRNNIQHRFRLQASEKSLPMLEKVQEILIKEFGRKLKIHFDGLNKYGTKIFSIQTSINRLKQRFFELGIDKKSLPKWIEENTKMFFIYLAASIDGDGTVCVKRRKTYPQCTVRIISGKINEKLQKHIENNLNCSCWIEPMKRSKSSFSKRNIVGYRHCFYVSSKNKEIFRKSVLPHIQLNYKRRIIENYIGNSQL